MLRPGGITLEAIIRLLKRDKSGISNVIVVMLSLILIVMIVGNVVLWSYQMNQLDLERIQEKVQITNVTRMAGSPWFTAQKEFSITAGSRVSGTYTDTNFIDDVHETFREEFTSGGTGEISYRYNPSTYAPLGYTTLVSGSITDLQNEDNVYMRFRSYVSASSLTAKTDAFIVYRDSTNSLNTPKLRTWTGEAASWSSQVEMPDAGSPVRTVRVAYCPIEERSFERIVVTCSDDGYLDVYVWNGTTWIVTNNIAQVWTTAPTGAQRPYDIAYETASGRALIVYDVVVADAARDLGYRVWNGTTWSEEYYIDFTGVASVNPTISFVCLASNPDPASAQIALAFQDDTNSDAFAGIWNGSTWEKMTTISTAYTTVGRETIAIEYSTYYRKILVVSGNGQNSMAWKYYIQGDDDWTTGASFDPDPDGINDVCFSVLKRDPAGNSQNDFVMYTGVNDLWDLNAWAFNMSADPPTRVHIANEVDERLDSTTTRCVDFAWEPTGNKGLIVWGTTAGRINYNTYSVSTGWGASWTTYVAMGAYTHPWVQLRTNTRNINGDVKILGAVLEKTALDLGAIQWDGTTLTVIGSTMFSSDTTTTTYECFEIEFMNFGPSTEFTAEAEFIGASNTESWDSLTWMVDLSCTTIDVNATLQLYNYEVGAYPTSGDGYITDTIGTTDTIENQTITTNSTHFRDTSGEWKLKIKCAKATDTPFEFKVDWISYETTVFGTYRLDINNDFVIDLANYPLNKIQRFEILIRYNATESSEKWFIKTYNWATASFSDAGFNSTEGSQPTSNQWNEYAISITENLANYVSSNGTVRVEFSDNGTSMNQTTIEIDFFAVKATIGGANVSVKNSSPSTTHIVALWVISQTNHKRLNTNLFINSGEEATYTLIGVELPEDKFIVKIVTERGNMAVFVVD
ncbi:MAG: hypothetical protein ACUVUF_01095 [Candidatus Bathycorpusculaceae bacterium]